MHGNSDSLADRPGKSPVRFRAPCVAAIGVGTPSPLERFSAGFARARSRTGRGPRAWRRSRCGRFGCRRRAPPARSAGRLGAPDGNAVRRRWVAVPTGAHGARCGGTIEAPRRAGAVRCDGASRPIPARPGPRRPTAKGASGFRRGRLRSPAPPDRACGGLGGGSPDRPARRARAYRPAGLGMR